MKVLRVLLLAFVIIAYSPVSNLRVGPFTLGSRPALGAESIDYATQRNGMHSCPTGSFVTGVHLGRNQLLCSTYFGGYAPGAEYTDNSSQQRGWHPEGDVTMHGCPSGAVTGVFGGNLLACAPLARGSLFVDKSNQRAGMHACPNGTVLVGFHANRNWLLCVTFRETLSGREVQRHDMVSCPPGLYITGLHVRQNKLLCSAEFGRWHTEVVHRSTTCPTGTAATGIHNGRNLIACAPFANQGPRQNQSVQRSNMEACPLGSVLLGFVPWREGQDRPLAGTVGFSPGIVCARVR